MKKRDKLSKIDKSIFNISPRFTDARDWLHVIKSHKNSSYSLARMLSIGVFFQLISLQTVLAAECHRAD